MKFKQLAIGQEFDFIKPNSIYNSFFLRCTKITSRGYRDSNGTTHKVGSITCEVYNVTPVNTSEDEFNRIVNSHCDTFGTYVGKIDGREFCIERESLTRYSAWWKDDSSVVCEASSPFDAYSDL